MLLTLRQFIAPYERRPFGHQEAASTRMQGVNSRTMIHHFSAKLVFHVGKIGLADMNHFPTKSAHEMGVFKEALLIQLYHVDDFSSTITTFFYAPSSTNLPLIFSSMDMDDLFGEDGEIYDIQLDDDIIGIALAEANDAPEPNPNPRVATNPAVLPAVTAPPPPLRACPTCGDTAHIAAKRRCPMKKGQASDNQGSSKPSTPSVAPYKPKASLLTGTTSTSSTQQKMTNSAQRKDSAPPSRTKKGTVETLLDRTQQSVVSTDRTPQSVVSTDRKQQSVVSTDLAAAIHAALQSQNGLVPIEGNSQRNEMLLNCIQALTMPAAAPPLQQFAAAPFPLQQIAAAPPPLQQPAAAQPPLQQQYVAPPQSNNARMWEPTRWVPQRRETRAGSEESIFGESGGGNDRSRARSPPFRVPHLAQRRDERRSRSPVNSADVNEWRRFFSDLGEAGRALVNVGRLGQSLLGRGNVAAVASSTTATIGTNRPRHDGGQWTPNMMDAARNRRFEDSRR